MLCGKMFRMRLKIKIKTTTGKSFASAAWKLTVSTMAGIGV